MKQNNRKNTWKAIVAVMLVMASLFAVSTAVSAGFGELILDEEYIVILSVTSSSEPKPLKCEHPIVLFSHYEDCDKGHSGTVQVDACMTSHCPYTRKHPCPKCQQNT